MSEKSKSEKSKSEESNKFSQMNMSPYVIVKGAADAIDFYCDVFGAKEKFRLVDPGDGRIGHAELEFGESTMMIADEYADFGALGPVSYGGSPIKLHLVVEDVDSMFARAIDAGAIELRPLKDEFYGSRTGAVTDPFGHVWHLDMEVDSVSPEKMQQLWNDAGSE